MAPPAILQGMGLHRNSYSHHTDMDNMNDDTNNKQRQRKNRIRSLRERRNKASLDASSISESNNSFASFDEFNSGKIIETKNNQTQQNVSPITTFRKQNKLQHEFKHEHSWDWDTTNNDISPFKTRNVLVTCENGMDNMPMTSPSSLHTFDCPRRKSKKTIQSSQSNSNHEEQKQQQQQFIPQNNNVNIDQLPNPNKLMESVRFRNRFASAALVAQKLNNNHDNDEEENDHRFPENMFIEQDEELKRRFEDSNIPTQLFFHKNMNVGSKSHDGGQFRRNDDKKMLPFTGSSANSSSDDDLRVSKHFDETNIHRRHHRHLHNTNNNISNSAPVVASPPQSKSKSYSYEWPSIAITSPSSPHLHNHDESYESFGNQSVFSDITGSVGMPSPTRDNIHKKLNHHRAMMQYDASPIFREKDLNSPANASETLFEVKCEEEYDFDKNHDKMHGANNTTASTFHLSIEESEDQDENDSHGVNTSTKSSKEETIDYDDSSNTNNVKKSKVQSRLASLFSNRVLQYDNSYDDKRRSKSAPKMRKNDEVEEQQQYKSPERTNYQQNTHIDRMLESPAASHVRSNTSDASSSYVGWPGTIGKDGTTIAITSSFSDDGVGGACVIDRQLILDPSQKPYNIPNQEGMKLHTVKENENVKSGVNNRSKSISENKEIKKKLSFGFGRNRFEKKQRQDNLGEESTIEKSVPSSVSALKQQLEAKEEVVDLDEVPDSDSEDEKLLVKKDAYQKPTDRKSTPKNAADIYLAKAVIRAKSSSSSPCLSPVNVPKKDLNVTFPAANPPSRSKLQDIISPQKMRVVRNSEKSSLYSDIKKLNKVNHVVDSEQSSGKSSNNLDKIIDVSASLRRVRSASRTHPLSSQRLGSIPEHNEKFRLSEEALRRNEQLSPVRSNASGANVRGFRGFLDKTKDVPNLMDDDDSCTTVSTMTSEQKMIRRTDITDWKAPCSASALVQGKSPNAEQSFHCHGQQMRSFSSYENRKLITPNPFGITTPKVDEEDTNDKQISLSYTTVQPSISSFHKSKTLKEFDADLSESDTDFFTSDEQNKFPQRRSNGNVSPSDISDDGSGSSESTSSSSPYSDNESYLNLSQFTVDPKNSRKMVKFFRNTSNFLLKTAIDPCAIEDSKKAFALFEMRSRIMETDIERGLERKGGTSTVDDIVLSPYFQASYRVRDAVIVSRSWREGATPTDARTAYNLTKGEYSYILNRITLSNLDVITAADFSFDSKNSWLSQNNNIWEKVLWTDDTDFAQIRCPCPSLDGGFIRGFDMFTLGDCQSILLKLTNEYCEETQKQLNDAIQRQMIAEHIMKDEAIASDNSMTEAEDAYLEAMEEVKILSRKLNGADKAFEMTREKIEALVTKYENILNHIDENGESQIVSHFVDDSDASTFDKDAKEKLTRRAQRAEIEAQKAKLEAEKSKQEVERIKSQKEQELTLLQKKLEELEAKSAMLESDFEAKLQSQKVLASTDFYKKCNVSENGAHSSLLYAASTVGIDQDKNEAKERIKAKFRQRRSIGNGNKGSVQQHLNFYERSLQAIERK